MNLFQVEGQRHADAANATEVSCDFRGRVLIAGLNARLCHTNLSSQW